MINSECSQLLQTIYEASFALNDTVLFLDTHPCDKDALSYYQYVKCLRQEAMDAYCAQCGPLMNDQVNANNYWNWVNDKWPWEGGNC